ncbi:MAG: hypothetical protein K2X82_12480 [Gemmataceae bacterium]|nr:hypothetical protein [Gemmataceae bacterium]
MSEPRAVHDFHPGGLPAALEFLKRARWELREPWFVRVWPDRYQLFDVNKDFFEVRGVGYPDPDVAALLRMVNAAFDPAAVGDPTGADYKQFFTGRRFPWAHDRVM